MNHRHAPAGGVLPLGLLVAVLAAPASAQEEQAPRVIVQTEDRPLSQAQQAAGPIEEVLVTGQRTLGSLLREGAQLTEEFYGRLNEVINQDDFRINCDNEFPTGSNISRRVCRIRFVERLMNQDAVSIIQSIEANQGDIVVSPAMSGSTQAQITARMDEFETVLLDAVNTDLLLNQQVVRLLALKSAIENFESPRNQRRREARELEESLEQAD